MGADNHVTSCDLGVFVDQAAESVAPQHADARTFCGRIGSSDGRILLQRGVAGGFVVIDVLTVVAVDLANFRCCQGRRVCGRVARVTVTLAKQGLR